MKKRFRLLQALIVLICLVALYYAAKPDIRTSYEPLSEEDDTVYTIGICSSYKNANRVNIEQGYVDALYDTFGEDHLQLVYAHYNDNTELEDTIYTLLNQSQPDLLFTVGSDTLNAASIATLTIPIVATDVISFRQALHTFDHQTEDDGFRNITGISSLPNIAEHLSLLIESSSPRLRAVGILYNPEDRLAIYQNEIMEHYLTEADIPWREYKVQMSPIREYRRARDLSMSDYVIRPETSVAASGKEGINIEIDPIGENSILTSINEPQSARPAQRSDNWEERIQDSSALTYNVLEDHARHITEETEEVSDDQMFIDEDLEGGSPIAAVMEQACLECSALYISSGSLLSDQMSEIRSFAEEYKTVTVGGDANIGVNTLVSTFTDVYDQGYRAGKQTYQILVNGRDPSQIRIGSSTASPIVKLYQNDIANTLDVSFPKSFREIDFFLRAYIPGFMTNRIVYETDEKTEE